jgi:hypothetical protein
MECQGVGLQLGMHTLSGLTHTHAPTPFASTSHLRRAQGNPHRALLCNASSTRALRPSRTCSSELHAPPGRRYRQTSVPAACEALRAMPLTRIDPCGLTWRRVGWWVQGFMVSGWLLVWCWRGGVVVGDGFWLGAGRDCALRPVPLTTADHR